MIISRSKRRASGLPGHYQDLMQKNIMWQDWTNAVLGLAVIGVAFLGLEPTTLMWTLGVLGGIITVLGIWGAATASEGSAMSHA